MTDVPNKISSDVTSGTILLTQEGVVDAPDEVYSDVTSGTLLLTQEEVTNFPDKISSDVTYGILLTQEGADVPDEISSDVTSANILSTQAGDVDGQDKIPSAITLTPTILPYEGICTEHSNYRQMRCMTCCVWICGVCAALSHNRCRYLLISEALKDMKAQNVTKIDAEMAKRNEKLNYIHEVLTGAEEMKKLIKCNIKQIQINLKQKISELNKINQDKRNLIILKMKVKSSLAVLRDFESNMNYSSTKDFEDSENKFSAFQQQIQLEEPIALPYFLMNHFKLTDFVKLKNKGIPMYVVRGQDCNARWAKVALKDGRICIYCFQEERPAENFVYIAFRDFLASVAGCSFPQRAFLEIWKGNFKFGDVIIKVKAISPRGLNFLLLCSGVKGKSYQGTNMYMVNQNDPAIVNQDCSAAARFSNLPASSITLSTASRAPSSVAATTTTKLPRKIKKGITSSALFGLNKRKSSFEQPITSTFLPATKFDFSLQTNNLYGESNCDQASSSTSIFGGSDKIENTLSNGSIFSNRNSSTLFLTSTDAFLSDLKTKAQIFGNLKTLNTSEGCDKEKSASAIDNADTAAQTKTNFNLISSNLEGFNFKPSVAMKTQFTANTSKAGAFTFGHHHDDSISGGDYLKNNGEGSPAVVKGIKNGGIYAAPKKRGLVEGMDADNLNKLSCFSVVLTNDINKHLTCCFAEVEKGLEALQMAATGRDVQGKLFNVVVRNCGLIFDKCT